jgi:hypothetical protein
MLARNHCQNQSSLRPRRIYATHASAAPSLQHRNRGTSLHNLSRLHQQSAAAQSNLLLLFAHLAPLPLKAISKHRVLNVGAQPLPESSS